MCAWYIVFRLLHSRAAVVRVSKEIATAYTVAAVTQVYSGVRRVCAIEVFAENHGRHKNIIICACIQLRFRGLWGSCMILYDINRKIYTNALSESCEYTSTYDVITSEKGAPGRKGKYGKL